MALENSTNTNYTVSHSTGIIKGKIQLEGSKSITNRVLLIRALCDEHFTIYNPSPSDDSKVLQDALENNMDEYDMGHAGTSIRFLTAFLSIKNNEQDITGSERMLLRPIGPLVEALNHIGCDITHKKEAGFPPLKIGAFKSQKNNKVTIDSTISSQFISALCMIAPSLPEGLEIELTGDIVSRSYIELTLGLMSYFGVNSTWVENIISIKAQKYEPKDITIEADWSAASYFYIIAALAKECEITLYGLKENSLQGDQAIQSIAPKFGVSSFFKNDTLTIKKIDSPPSPMLENNFITHPDIAQSIAVICGGLGISGLFSGLQTLAIKETDRTAALKKELRKLGVSFYKLPTKKFAKNSGLEYFMMDGTVIMDKVVSIATYKDHRMAMAFAPLGIFNPIEIEDISVVSKSYPGYWEDLQKLGFILA